MKVKPPKYASENAKKAKECIKQGSKAMTSSGRKRMNELIKRKPLDLKDLQEIDSFSRHKHNAKYSGNICKDKGAVAWLGWGYGFKDDKPSLRLKKWVKRKKEKIE